MLSREAIKEKIKSELNIVNICVEEDFIEGTFDYSPNRYKLSILKRKSIDKISYIISASNLFFSMETHNPKNCEYKMLEHDILPGDAINVETIFGIMLDMLNKK